MLKNKFNSLKEKKIKRSKQMPIATYLMQGSSLSLMISSETVGTLRSELLKENCTRKLSRLMFLEGCLDHKRKAVL